jgi:DNA-binding LytR/AlgR family response regulator
MAAPLAIMLLDDQQDWLRINCNALEKAGLKCEAFVDRGNALNAFKEAPERYALVLVDVNLGGQPDGIAMAKQFLQIKPDANLVLISTKAQLHGREKDLEEIAQTTGLKYFRKKGDEEGGTQIVNIARQYFLAFPGVSARSNTQSLSAGALQTWLDAKEEPPDNG